MQYRKKPVVIEASQWFKNGDHPKDYSVTHQGLENGEMREFWPSERKAAGWEGDIVRYFRHPDVSSEKVCEHCGNTMHVHGWIDTLEGGHIVCPGDWIITGVKGEHYPCKPDIFAATYEPVDSAPAPAGAEAQQDAPATDRKCATCAHADLSVDTYPCRGCECHSRWEAGVAAPAGADIDAKLEQLIEESDGQWREDVFLIEASPLWELLRQAAALSGAPAVAVAEPPWKTMTDDESMRLGKGHTPAQVYAVAEAHGRRYLLPSRFDTSDDATAQRRACEALVASGHARWLTVNQALGIRLTGKPLTSSPAAKEDQRG